MYWLPRLINFMSRYRYTRKGSKVSLSNLNVHQHYSHVTGKITPFQKHEWLIEKLEFRFVNL